MNDGRLSKQGLEIYNIISFNDINLCFELIGFSKIGNFFENFKFYFFSPNQKKQNVYISVIE